MRVSNKNQVACGQLVVNSSNIEKFKAHHLATKALNVAKENPYSSQLTELEEKGFDVLFSADKRSSKRFTLVNKGTFQGFRLDGKKVERHYKNNEGTEDALKAFINAAKKLLSPKD